MNANKSGGEFLQWLCQLLRKTVRASTETALDVIFCVSIRVYSRAFAVEYLALVQILGLTSATIFPRTCPFASVAKLHGTCFNEIT
jgi:hypothetical protein